MAYQYRGTATIEVEVARQEQLKAELAEERAKLREAMRIRKENERLERQILATQQRAEALAKPLPTQPAPIHGGRIGLKRAADEIDAYNKRKKAVA